MHHCIVLTTIKSRTHEFTDAAEPRDPEAPPEPHLFNPQRWIDDAGRVRDNFRFFTFGFGRR